MSTSTIWLTAGRAARARRALGPAIRSGRPRAASTGCQRARSASSSSGIHVLLGAEVSSGQGQQVVDRGLQPVRGGQGVGDAGRSPGCSRAASSCSRSPVSGVRS